ncbi:MAG: hypothetical protein R2821_03150 [Flavobacteriaceae bacterium]|nr:hypothetical protein [Flavobacteriaceae bacterium]
MKNLLTFLVLFLLLSCSDGNIDVPGFDFSGIDPAVQRCNEDKLVIYSINDTEALIIELKEKNDTLFVNEGTYTYDLKETGTDKITYRTFDAKPTSSYFCQSVPPTTPMTLNEWTGTNGELIITVELDRKDDNDGVDEEANDALDTDGDTVPNYLDDDDDGDRIPTSEEKGKDTDSDGIPDYLDNDDDGDGILTINESKTDDDDGDGIVNYLDIDSRQSIEPNRPEITNTYTEYYKASFIINGLQLVNANGNTIQYDVYDDLGNFEDSKVIE